MRYKILSLLDITKTMARRNRSEDDKSIDQYANYMTFENSLQLRSNVSIIAGPTVEKLAGKIKINTMPIGNHNCHKLSLKTIVFSLFLAKYLAT